MSIGGDRVSIFQTFTSGALTMWYTRMLIVFLTLSGMAFSQTRVQADFGVRGGVLGDAVFRAHRLCSGSACFFGSTSFGAENLPGTIGMLAAVLVNERVEVRFEAVRERFG